jgi:hypothetical protein
MSTRESFTRTQSTARRKASCDLGDPVSRDEVGADQVADYRARAPWYDDAYTSCGDCDQGPTLNAQWRADLASIETLMSRANPARRLCGARRWTFAVAGLTVEIAHVSRYVCLTGTRS